MMMVATGGRILADETFKDTVEDGGKTEKTLWRCSSTRCHMIDTFVAVMQFMTTATSGIHCNKLKIHVWQICGSVQYLLSFWLSQRLTRFWFNATFSTLVYVRKVCLRYWSFVGSWRGNLLTIYTLVGGRKGGMSSWQTPLLGWGLHQVTLYHTP